MSANEVHIGDIGTIFELTVMDGASVVDVSTATTKEIVFRKPDGSTATKTAAFTTNGSDGKIRYTTVALDLSVAGDWAVQAHVVLPTGEWRSDLSTFRVYPNL